MKETMTMMMKLQTSLSVCQLLQRWLVRSRSICKYITTSQKGIKFDVFSGFHGRLSNSIEVNVCHDKSSAVVFMPGFSLDDIDRASHIAPWKYVRKGETGRLASFGMLGETASSSYFLRLNELVKERLFFLISNNCRSDPSLFTLLPTEAMDTLSYKISLLGIGRSSVTFGDEFRIKDKVLSRSVLQGCFVDTTSRKPVPLPRWFTNEFGHIRNPAPVGLPVNERLSALTPPKDVFAYRTVIEYSDLDYYGHTNHSAYVRIVCNAASHASVSGCLQPFEGDLAFQEIERMHFVYQGETSVGDEVEVLVWVDEHQMGTVNMLMRRAGVPVFLAKFCYRISVNQC